MAEIKVTDKRMFTPDGQLREEYASVASAPSPDVQESPAAPSPAVPEPAPQPAEVAAHAPRTPTDEGEASPAPSFAAQDPPLGEGPRLELPGTPPGMGPSFYDLVAVLAEPISLYLGDIPLPDGESAENLEAARFHIDLLDVLRQRTAGHVSAQERAVLEDLLYRTRMRYVQKRG